MGKWHWPTRDVAHLHFKKCATVIAKILLFTGFLVSAPGIAFTQDAQKPLPSRDGNAPANDGFDGTYTIHLSENPRVRSSARPEPGYFDSLAIELFSRAGLNAQTVAQQPWKRQMEMAEREAGHVIYPTTRIGHREDVFKWVGPVSRTFWNLFGFAESGWSESSFETLLNEARIGVLMGSARADYLRHRGAQQLIVVPREELLLPMMMAGRVDLIAVGGIILRHYVAKTRAENPDITLPDVTGIMPYRTCYLYIAISGDVPDSDITKLQTQLDRFKTNGFFVENRRAHGLSTNQDSAFLKAMLDLDNNGVTCVDLTGPEK